MPVRGNVQVVRGISATAATAPSPEEVGTPEPQTVTLKRVVAAPSLRPTAVSSSNDLKEAKKRALLEESDFEWPEEKSVMKQSLSDLTIIIYGPSGCGKTSLANEFPECGIMATEDGGGGIEGYIPRVTRWLDYKRAVRRLAETDRFRTIAVDVIDKLYTYNSAYVCARDGFTHPSEVPYGAGWDAITKEYQEGIDLLWEAKKDRGLIFISHAADVTHTNWDGTDLNRIVPSASVKAIAPLAKPADLIIYYGFFGTQRLMCITPSDFLEAKQRLSNNFWVKGWEGVTRVHSIPAGNTPKEAYDNLLKAFNNEQTSDGNPELDAVLIKKKTIKKKD